MIINWVMFVWKVYKLLFKLIFFYRITYYCLFCFQKINYLDSGFKMLMDNLYCEVN